MASISLRNVVKRYGKGKHELQVIHGVNAEVADREFIVIVGPSGCGKSTLLRMVAGPGGDLRRRDLDRRPRGQQPRAGRARHRHGVPELRALSAHERVRQHGLRPEDQEGAARRDQDPRRQGRGHPRARPPAGPQAAPAVRRPAPARGHGPRHRAPAPGVPVRRAAVQPGRQAARADPHRDPEAASRAGHHLAVRHPRPGRGDDAGAAHDRHERRRHGAVRHARGGVSPSRIHLRRQLHRLAADEPAEERSRRPRRNHHGHPARSTSTSATAVGRCGWRPPSCWAPSG